MARSIAPGRGNVPVDKGFSARSADDPRRQADAEAVAATALEDVQAASNAEKLAYYEARAQQMANDRMCSVLCHWIVLPHFEHTPPTLEAVLIPGDENQNWQTAPEPWPPRPVDPGPKPAPKAAKHHKAEA